jgi:molybdenum cofactor cytidylyltransferase
MDAIAGLLLAAGASRRMGRPKLLLPVGGKPMLRWAAEALVAAGLSPVVAVLGHEALAVGETLAGLPVLRLENRSYPEGQASSLRAGVGALPPTCRAAAVALGDMPGLRAAAVVKLVEAFRSGGKGIALPVYHGRRGHPVVFDLERYRTELLALSGDEGGRSLLARHTEDVLEVPVGDAGVLLDVDTPEAYERTRHAASLDPR